MQETPEPNNPCHGLGLVLVGAEDVYFFSFGDKGCAGFFSIFLGGPEISGETSDLSYLGFEAGQPVKLSIIKQGDQFSLQLNDQEVTIITDVPPIGPLGGIRLFTKEQIAINELTFSFSGTSVDLMQKNKKGAMPQ